MAWTVCETMEQPETMPMSTPRASTMLEGMTPTREKSPTFFDKVVMLKQVQFFFEQLSNRGVTRCAVGRCVIGGTAGKTTGGPRSRNRLSGEYMTRIVLTVMLLCLRCCNQTLASPVSVGLKNGAPSSSAVFSTSIPSQVATGESSSLGSDGASGEAEGHMTPLQRRMFLQANGSYYNHIIRENGVESSNQRDDAPLESSFDEDVLMETVNHAEKKKALEKLEATFRAKEKKIKRAIGLSAAAIVGTGGLMLLNSGVGRATGVDFKGAAKVKNSNGEESVVWVDNSRQAKVQRTIRSLGWIGVLAGVASMVLYLPIALSRVREMKKVAKKALTESFAERLKKMREEANSQRSDSSEG